MKVILKRPPEVEDHIVPEGHNLGVILLANSEFDLITPFAVAGNSGGPPGGATVPRSFVMQGSAGISSLPPESIARPRSVPPCRAGGA